MAEFFRNCTIWVVDYLYDGRPRRWFRAFAADAPVPTLMADELRELYAERARLVEVRPATEQEERDYLHDEQPRNAYCPLSRAPAPPRS
ncbi:hypothetical protein LZ017_04315 [Pelomonas sp. CA6]|uniref:hypothetical protein n=1 Tax=Pelomonas sp. CA6 TaxID=2907999 RepID=UPI001F4AAE0A|nr:hypothetical protein [Pelomonas sp. CA6]MCH7342601.1 hypothetical protein [Pelomonas sp. CA6]